MPSMPARVALRRAEQVHDVTVERVEDFLKGLTRGHPRTGDRLIDVLTWDANGVEGEAAQDVPAQAWRRSSMGLEASRGGLYLPLDLPTRLRGLRRCAPNGMDASGEGRNRTGDTTVFSRVLYRLSYLARRPAV